jgi:hypothetical protein
MVKKNVASGTQDRGRAPTTLEGSHFMNEMQRSRYVESASPYDPSVCSEPIRLAGNFPERGAPARRWHGHCLLKGSETAGSLQMPPTSNEFAVLFCLF